MLLTGKHRNFLLPVVLVLQRSTRWRWFYPRKTTAYTLSVPSCSEQLEQWRQFFLKMTCLREISSPGKQKLQQHLPAGFFPWRIYFLAPFRCWPSRRFAFCTRLSQPPNLKCRSTQCMLKALRACWWSVKLIKTMHLRPLQGSSTTAASHTYWWGNNAQYNVAQWPSLYLEYLGFNILSKLNSQFYEL